MRLPLKLSVFFLLLAAIPSWAHWTVDETAPPWCRRGELHWALHYGKVTRSDVDLMVAAHQNLLVGPGKFDSKQTRAYAASKGIHELVYICARTFRVENYKGHPELNRAVVRASDGTEAPAYDNPVRRFGCANCPEWKEYVLGLIERAQAKHAPAGIFFDNAGWFNLCYCGVCRGKFREYTQLHYGHAMELPDRIDPVAEVGRAARMFLIESQTAFHKALLEYCHQRQPRLLAVPNTCRSKAWPMYGIEEGITDMPFYELPRHPPFNDNLYLYKLALAAGHGRNVGMLLYLPEKIGALRGKSTWNEPMHHTFAQASPLAKEIALGIAEGAACGATYIANYFLFPSLPITDVNDPFNVGIPQTMTCYYDFLVRNRAIYLDADQGADVAILHSVPTDLWTNAYARGARMAERLNRAGIPYEVIVERDLKPQWLQRYKAIILDGVRNIAEADAAALLQYVQAGGSLMLAGACGVADQRGETHVSDNLRKLRANVRLPARDNQPVNLRNVGKGRVMVLPKDLSAADGATLRGAVERLMGVPGISVTNPTGKLSVNVLTQPAQQLREVHLLNYDFIYDKPADQQQPTHRQWEDMCRVRSASGVRIRVAGDQKQSAIALSPTAPPQRLTGMRVAGGAEFVVHVDLYTVVVLASDEIIEGICRDGEHRSIGQEKPIAYHLLCSPWCVDNQRQLTTFSTKSSGK